MQLATYRTSVPVRPHHRARAVAVRASAEAVAPTPRAQNAIPLCGKTLKEWAPAVTALGQGYQTVLFRKGGIKEPTFRPESKEFLLFPTGFHTDQQLLKPLAAERYATDIIFDPKSLMGTTLELPFYAQVTGAWTTHDTSVFAALDAFHVWAPGFVDVRLKWRQKQPVTILELRVWQLREPAQVALTDDLFGCFSWVDLSSYLPAGGLEGARPAIPDAEWAEKQRALRAALQGMDVQELVL